MSEQSHNPATTESTEGAAATHWQADEFGSATDNQQLRGLILDEIDRWGRITFRRFMELALYHPEEGYYRVRPAIGGRGDYVTSPELHPLFGAILARQLLQFWELLGRPSPFQVVEMGAGNGSLARSVLTAVRGDLLREIRYIIIEPGSLQCQRQIATLGSLAHYVEWLDRPSARFVGCLLSNELVDSFPFHRVTVSEGRLLELYVGRSGDAFIDLIGEPSTPDLPGYFAELGLLSGEGCQAEVNLDALTWMTEIGELLTRGFVLTIDYGYAARRLYAPWRRAGTLLTFFQHTSNVDPYERVGRQDITSHVDFTSLAMAGRKVGLDPVGFTSQQRFLAALGIQDALAGGPSAAPGLEEFLARRGAVSALLDPEGLGRLRVFAQSKGIHLPTLRGFDADSLQELSDLEASGSAEALP